jgi:hypothetical protein
VARQGTPTPAPPTAQMPVNPRLAPTGRQCMEMPLVCVHAACSGQGWATCAVGRPAVRRQPARAPTTGGRAAKRRRGSHGSTAQGGRHGAGGKDPPAFSPPKMAPEHLQEPSPRPPPLWMPSLCTCCPSASCPLLLEVHGGRRGRRPCTARAAAAGKKRRGLENAPRLAAISKRQGGGRKRDTHERRGKNVG